MKGALVLIKSKHGFSKHRRWCTHTGQRQKQQKQWHKQRQHNSSKSTLTSISATSQRMNEWSCCCCRLSLLRQFVFGSRDHTHPGTQTVLVSISRSLSLESQRGVNGEIGALVVSEFQLAAVATTTAATAADFD